MQKLEFRDVDVFLKTSVFDKSHIKLQALWDVERHYKKSPPQKPSEKSGGHLDYKMATEAVARGSSIKKVFLEIFQNW